MLQRWIRLPRIFRTFRFRLSALYLAIFGTLQIGLAGAILFVREFEIRREFDNRLFNRATLLGLTIAGLESAADEQVLQRLVAELLRRNLMGGYTAMIQAGDGRPLAHTEDFSADDLHQLRATLQPGPRPRPIFTTILRDGSGAAPTVSATSIRVVSLTQQAGDATPLILHVGQDLRMLDESIVSLRRLILSVGASGLVLAAGASWFVAKLSLRPIERVVRETSQISPRDLSSRLSPPRTHDEIDRVVTVFNSLLERIERGFTAHERFAADVAHELKTPLAVIQSEVQLLTRGDPSDPQWRHFAGSVEDEMRRMSRLVDALLMAARANAGYPLPAGMVVDIADVVVAAVDLCLILARDSGVSLVIKTPPVRMTDLRVPGDPDLLVTVLVNVIRNAIKASPRGQAVEVDASADATSVLLTVSDRGSGMPPSRRPQLFRRFEAEPGRWNGIGGVGLGLSIVSSILAIHSGALMVRDRAGGGSEVVVSLPQQSRSPDPCGMKRN